jgi:hypothetical protein
VQAPPPEGEGQQELRAGRGDGSAQGLDSAADDDLQGHEAEHAGQPFNPARYGLPAVDIGPEDCRVPGLDHVGDGGAAEDRQDEAEHRQGRGCCPAMSEQRGDVLARPGAKSAPDDDGAGQIGAERNRQHHQERDEAECEHGSKLKRAVDESDLT